MLAKFQRKSRRALRTRSKMNGTPLCPRLSIFRSNTTIYAQAIDDTTGTTLASASSLSLDSGTKTEQSTLVGKEIAEKMLAANIKTCIFDRGGSLYHGRVQALAEAAREA